MQADERKAAEEAEKRLKAALTAKREPTSASRVASPGEGEQSATADQNQESKAPPSESPSGEPAAMDVDVSVVPPAPEVCPIHLSVRSVLFMYHWVQQSPWLPELYPLFDDIRTIAPGNAAEVLGYVSAPLFCNAVLSPDFIA